MSQEFKTNGAWGADESAQYKNASNVSQNIGTIGAADVTVTLKNAHVVGNETDTAATIYIKIGEETTFAPYYFGAGQEKVLNAAAIGGTTTGTTAATKIVVRGVE